jgi:hypothetical protein
MLRGGKMFLLSPRGTVAKYTTVHGVLLVNKVKNHHCPHKPHTYTQPEVFLLDDEAHHSGQEDEDNKQKHHTTPIMAAAARVMEKPAVNAPPPITTERRQATSMSRTDRMMMRRCMSVTPKWEEVVCE